MHINLHYTQAHRLAVPVITNIASSIVPLLLLTTTILSSIAVNTSHASEINYLNLTFEELSKIEISVATGSNTPIDQAPAVASVITADEIKAMGARTLDQVLESIPGLHISTSSFNRLDSIYSIRGIHTQFNPHVLLLANGVPVQWVVQGGRPLLLRYPTTVIERVEVIRGPGSAIYGADAYAGVINIITKQSDGETQTEFGAQTGSFNILDTWAQHTQKLGSWNLGVTLNYQESNGDDSRTINRDFQSFLDDIYGTNASLAPGSLSTRYKILDAHINLNKPQWTFNFWSWNSDDAGNGAGGAQALDPDSGDNYDLYLADLTYKTSDWLPSWNHSIRVSHSFYKTQANFTLLPKGAFVPISEIPGALQGNLNLSPTAAPNVLFTEGLIGNPGGTTEDSQIDFTGIFDGWDRQTWRFNLGARRQSAEPSETKNFGPGVIDGSTSPIDGSLTDVSNTDFVFLPNTSRTINYMSIQNEWQLPYNWRLITGVRYDNYSDFGNTTNPRVALIWQTNRQLTTKLLYGSAFRAPSFSELFNRNNPSIIGNPDLRPETIETYELSFNYRPQNNIQTALSIFSYQAKDLIESAPLIRVSNARDQEGYGFEWELDWRPTKQLRLQSNFAWQQSEDSHSGNDIADAPGQQFTVNGYWEFRPQWFLNSRVNWVADRQRTSNDSRANIKDYTLVDFTLQRKNIIPNLDLGLSINNIFNEDAREPSLASPGGVLANDIPLEERNFRIELRYTFN